MFNCSFSYLLYSVVYAITIILLIVAIAFLTVLERKTLAAIQRRRGPNVVGLWGLLQAVADGLKLLSKEPLFVSGANYYIFLLAPIVLLSLSLTVWLFIPIPGFQFGVNTAYSFVVIFLFSGLNSFAIILAGIASNSRYSLIGGIRAIAQLISYEIPLSVTLLTLFCIQSGYNLHQFAGSKIFLSLVALPSLAIFIISLIAETNRTPFDLPEAEAELVAGYNLEYSSILFSLFFLAEYSNILVASSMISLLFFSEKFFFLGVVAVCLFIIFIRAILPRYTFEQLIKLCWCTLFPLSLFLLILVVICMFVFDLYSSDFIRPEFIDMAGAALSDNNFISTTIAATPLFAINGTSFFSNGDANYGVSSSFIVLYFFIAFLIVCALVGVNWVFINFRANSKKNSPYECGFEPVGSPISDFSPNFLGVALMFIIYDVEVLLTFPWAYSGVGRSVTAVCIFVFFLWLMLLGLAYEILDESFSAV